MVDTGMRRSRMPKPWVMVVMFSLALNVFMVQRIKMLERALGERSGNELKVGESLGPIEAKARSGATVHIRYEDSEVPTLLYVMSPQCVWCQRNNANMKALFSGAGERFRMFVLSVVDEGVEKYKTEHHVSSDILTLSPTSIRQLRLLGTPGTLVISPTGKVLHAWHGAYSDEAVEDIEKRFGVKLPGLSETATRPGAMISPTTPS